MLVIHTIENAYDRGNQYHQFVQRAGQSLLDSKAISSDETLRDFCISSVIDGCVGPSDFTAPQRARLERFLTVVMEKREISKLFDFAERIHMRDHPGGDVAQTRFGEWGYDSYVIEPASLREQQENVWGEDTAFPKHDWRYEVASGGTTLGYWEWVEHCRESEAGEPITPALSAGGA